MTGRALPRVRLADRRPAPAAAAHDHGDRPGHLGQQPAPASGPDRPRRRVQGARRRRSTTCSAAWRRRSSRSGTSWPTPPTNCAPRSPPSEPCSRWRWPTPTPPPRPCARPARRCWSSATSRNVSSRRCSPWPAASAASSSWEPFDLADIAGKVIEERRQEAERRGIHLEAALAAAPATGDPSLAESLVANLVDNAVRHNIPGGRAEVSTTMRDGRAVIRVTNTGTGSRPTRWIACSSRSSNSATSGYGTATATGSAWPSSVPSPTPTGHDHRRRSSRGRPRPRGELPLTRQG